MAAEGALIAHPELEERLHHPDSYSSAQRLDSATAPTTEVTRMASDGRGRLTAVTPPDAGTHLYGYTSAGQLASYAPPPLVSVAPESWQYSSDLLLASQGHADGQQTVVRRDTFGRVASVVTPWHATDVTYVSATGQVSSLRRSGRQVSSLWDGPLLTSESSTGLAAVGWTYDADFRVASMAIDGVPTARTYDADGLLTSVGPVQLARAPSSGRLVSTTVGPVSTAYAYSQYGELQSVTTSVSGTVLYSQGLSHDAVGNPLVSEESLSGSTRQESYSYDAVFVEKHLGSARAVVHDSTPCRSGGQTSCSLGRSMTWSLRF
jgi:YD repeat-containing protein